MSDASLSDLLKAGVHFGHKTYRWNPKMFPYIYSEVNNIHILDLVQSATLLKEAQSYVKLAASQGKKFLFIGTKRQARELIKDEAVLCHSFYVNERWLGGMLTNWVTVKKRIDYLKDLQDQHDNNRFGLLTKKEAVLRNKEFRKLSKNLAGIKEMKNLPDIVILIDQKQEMTAVKECRKLAIPIVSILDTNCDPDLIDIPIPGNDDALGSIKLILHSLSLSILKGQYKAKLRSKLASID